MLARRHFRDRSNGTGNRCREALPQQIPRKPGVVGVWHETYQVGRAESVYVDTPVMGLAASTGARQVSGRMEHARDRLRDVGSKASTVLPVEAAS